MPIRFDQLTLQTALDLLKQRKNDAGATNRLFYNGDHWQEGAGWIGQRPPDGDAYSNVMAEIANAFVSENVIAEVTDRHQQGTIGREPAWRFTPQRQVTMDQPLTTDEQTRIAEAEAAITGWWDRRKPLELLQLAIIAVLLTEHATLRLYIPQGLRDAQGQVPRGTLADALDHIALVLCADGAAGMFLDPDTLREGGVYSYTDDDQAYVEVCYVDDMGNTVVRIIGNDAATASESPPIPLNGRLMMYEMHRRALITPQIRANQKGLNLALTQMMRNVNLAGSLERNVLNGEPPGEEIDDPDAPDGKRFVPHALPVGAGVTNFIVGALIYNERGEIIGRANPNVSYRDPVKIDTFIGTRDTFYAAIHGQAQQKHALMGGDATASGESRKQARAEFEASLKASKTRLDDLGRWLIETLLALGAFFSNQVERYADLRAEFDTRIDSGPRSAEEERADREKVGARLLSRETAMSRDGVDDVDAENAKITVDREQFGEQLLTAFDRGQ